ncbi:MAG: hypothetical protein K1T65_04250 [Candidatus Aramenus sp.]|nr:hypothetical protein [Candidatus Aramenus sp.]
MVKMRILRICGCGIVGIVGAFLILTSIFGQIAYFAHAPDVPLYLGVLLLTISGLSFSASLARPQEDF